VAGLARLVLEEHQRRSEDMVRTYRFLGVMALSVLMLAAAPLASAKGLLDQFGSGQFKHDQKIQERCSGAVTLVTDVGAEGLRTTAWNFNMVGGGGEGGRFDKTPVLQTRVELKEGCLNAHLSALVGSSQYYGVSTNTLFQVTLSQALPWGFGPPQHMYGHYETPYGVYAPAVVVEPEQDVDALGTNFFQRIGDGEGDVKPGVYLVEVWWAGGPIGGGGANSAIGAAFVLKLYQ
jgi:hypothetical protein